jgi:hypothetical protein
MRAGARRDDRSTQGVLEISREANRFRRWWEARGCTGALIVLIALTATAFGAAPATASVQFTKQWIGGSEFNAAQWSAADSDGNLYVTDTNSDRVLKLDPSGALIDAWGTSGGGPGQFSAPEGVAVDTADNVYVVEFSNQRVQKFDSSGNFILTWGDGVNQTTGGDVCTAASGDVCQGGSQGSTASAFNGGFGIVIDSANNVYVGEGSNQRIQKFDSSGNFILMWGKGVNQTTSGNVCTAASGNVCGAGTSGSGDGEFTGPQGLAADSANRIYVADAGNNRVQKFQSDGTFMTKWGSNGSSEGQFNLAGGVGVDASDNVYVTDVGNSRVQKFNSSGTFIRTWGWGVDTGASALEVCTSSCQAGIQGTGDGQFNNLEGVTAAPSGIYVADIDNGRVQRFSANGGFLGATGVPGNGGPYQFPFDVATDSSGHVFTSDIAPRVHKFDALGATLDAWGNSGTLGGQFSTPTGMTVDSSGFVYVVDRDNSRIEKFESDGDFVLTWGEGVNQTTGGDVCTAVSGDTCQAGTAGSADGQFNIPSGLAVDSAGNVYVADALNDRVQKFSSSGTFLDKWGTHGSANGQFDIPTDVATDSLGEVYVVDAQNNRVQRFSSTGTFLGKWGTVGSAPGQFQSPSRLIVDSQRNVYVSDTGNDRIQVFRPTGAFVKQWGSHGPGNGQLNSPLGIAVGTASRLYVADANNARVQVFTETDSTTPQTTIASGPSGTTNDPTPTFSFSSSEPTGALFECRVDGGTPDDFKPCPSPRTFPHLSDGTHTLQVRAIDAAGNVDATPAARMFQVRTASVSVSGSALVINAAPGAKDNIRVTRPSAGTIRVTDLPSGTYSGSGVHTGASCTRVGDYRADCAAAGVTLIRVSAGAMTDQVANSTVLRGALDGGPAADVLTGGSGPDTITGGPGADAMKGLGGNDSLRGRDLISDNAINCGLGTNDKADLDLLPKDAAVSGCEYVTRH